MNELLAISVARLNAAVARAQIRAMGMHAENLQRIHRGESQAYVEHHFNALIIDEGLDYSAVVRATTC